MRMHIIYIIFILFLFLILIFFSTYIKIHPYVIVEYLLDATNLVTIATNGTYQCING